MMRNSVFYLLIASLLLISCKEKQREETPWGTVVGEDTAAFSGDFTLGDMQDAGEMIMLTMSGPETYYDYHGYGMGLSYLLCEQFARQIGVSLRVEVCKDTAEMVSRLQKGEGDVVAYPLPLKLKGIRYCGAKSPDGKGQWAVRQDNKELADTLNSWYRPTMIAEVEKQERFLLSTQSVTRHVYSPMLNRAGGIISRYDAHFKRYAPLARWDWRLMAAQCYQESCFDPNARSWAGASGLMQIMPSTADHLGLSRSELFHPEKNIAASASYIRELSGHFSDVPSSAERQYFVLASYNGGYFHIRDAMALAKKHGQNPYSWGTVRQYVLALQNPAFYRDPVVRYGYMRGSETVDYVDRIRARYAQYRGVAGGGGLVTPIDVTPQRAKHRNRFK